MKAFKYFLFLFLILIIGFAIYVAVQPNEFSVTRTITLQAPQQLVFNNVSDFKNWEAWSSWREADPDMVIRLQKQTAGIGGSYEWEDKDGIGVIKTNDAKRFESLDQEMLYGAYPPSQITWGFRATPEGDTDVTWNISGKDLPFLFKFFCLIGGGMESQIGPHFERSLEKLDSILVADMNKYTINIEGVTEYGGGFYVYKTTNANDTNISTKMRQNFGHLMQFIQSSRAQLAGMPLTVYNEMNNNGTVIMSNSLPIITKLDIPDSADVSLGYMPKMKVLKTTLKGNYTYLKNAWSETMKHLEENGIKQSDQNPFEIYTNDPGKYPNPADWTTTIYIPLKE